MAAYYWCVRHGTVEEGVGCRADDRLGPYESAEAARAWRERHESRSDAWEAQDERWEGDVDADEDSGWV